MIVRPTQLEDLEPLNKALNQVCAERKYLATIEGFPLSGHKDFLSGASGISVGFRTALFWHQSSRTSSEPLSRTLSRTLSKAGLHGMKHCEFSFERLHVHSDLLQFLSTAEEHVLAWDPVHAVVDQFMRASEGAVVTLAEASRAHRLGPKVAAVDCSLGSVLECAACMDVAEAKSLITSENAHPLKRQLVAQSSHRPPFPLQSIQNPESFWASFRK